MKQSLELRLGQYLTMTPQLQQAIRLLQLSTLDLRQEIAEALESNMMLETMEDNNNFMNGDDYSIGSSEGNENYSSTSNRDESEVQLSVDIPDDLPLDSSWDDVYDSSHAASGSNAADDSFEPEANYKIEQTLRDHLLWQVELARFNEQDHAIAIAIIDCIDGDGYLMSSLQDIFEGLNNQMDDLGYDEVEAVLHRIHTFEPTGIGARDLQDCLFLQLSQLPENTPWRNTAMELISRFSNELATQDLIRLKRSLDISDENLSHVLNLIRTLDPYPGRSVHIPDTEYVIPDVFVVKNGARWDVRLNGEVIPKLRINPTYTDMIKFARNRTDVTTMKSHLQEARWFLKSLQSRNETLYKVARCIVDLQTDFLEYGPIAMKPLRLRDIAETVELHESTISRATTLKYMHTPMGIYEFKYFFSSHVSTESGGECSSTAIRAFIKELISGENTTKPLSDMKISELLKEKGINVARRTVAKYREAMSIPPSNQRKRIL